MSERGGYQFSVRDGGDERLKSDVLSSDCRRGMIETRGTTRSSHEVL